MSQATSTTPPFAASGHNRPKDSLSATASGTYCSRSSSSHDLQSISTLFSPGPAPLVPSDESNTGIRSDLQAKSLLMPDWALNCDDVLKHWSPRTSTVKQIVLHWKNVRILHFRATPSSGKSTLGSLIAAYIRATELNSLVVVCETLHKGKTRGLERIQEELRKYGCDAHPSVAENVYLIADEAQATYGDVVLWNSIKELQSEMRSMKILFLASMGSPVLITPVQFEENMRVSLRPTGQVPFGVYLSKEESADMVIRYGLSRRPAVVFSSDLQQIFYNISDGHGGVLETLCRMFYESKPGKEGQAVSECIDLNSIREEFGTIDRIIKTIDEKKYMCLRGIPPGSFYQEPDKVAVIQKCLLQKRILVTHTQLRSLDEEFPALYFCFTEGYLHSDLHDGEISFFFPTPLHRLYSEYMLIREHKENLSTLENFSDGKLLISQSLNDFVGEPF